MIHEFALTKVMGLPVVAYGGMFTFLLLLTTASIAFLHSKGKSPIPFKWHPRLAVLTIILAVIHGFFGISMVLGF